MKVKGIRQVAERRPFEPFVIRLTNGSEYKVNTRPSLGHPEASLEASWPSDRCADRARGIAGGNVASHEEWTRLRFKEPRDLGATKDYRSIFYFGDSGWDLIDTESIVEISVR